MDELIGEFLTETVEGLAVLDNDLVKLEQSPGDEQLLGNIFRVMHTIKGTCGFLGLSRLEAVAHSGENILGKIRDKQLQATPQAISLVLECIDAIKSIIEHLERTEQEPEGNDSELIARLNFYADNGSVMGGEATDSSPAAPEAAVSIETLLAEESTAVSSENTAEAVGSTDPAPVMEAAPVEVASDDVHHEEPAPQPVAPVAEVKKESPPPQPQPQAAPPAAKAPAPAADTHKEESGSQAATGSLRVNIEVLENLMQQVSELVLTRNQLLQMVRNDRESEFAAPLQRLSLVTSELQEGVMKTRMQPVGNVWSKFPRMIRDLAMDLGKKIDLKMYGEETELDRQLLDYIKDPLTHMIRNSADHGLEVTAERIAAGKPETGVIKLKAYHEGGHIIIEIVDDGRGINVARVRKKILEKNLATEAELAAMSEKQIQYFIFHAGFSTAEVISAVSGRGVGMDVVKNNIEKIGGTVELNSVEGKGTTFIIKIPLTLAIMSVLIVQSGQQKFAIPQTGVVEMVKTGVKSEHTIEKINDTPVLRLRERLLPLLSLSEVLKIPPAENTKETAVSKLKTREETFIVVCQVGEHSFGIMVDRVFDTEEIVVKRVAPVLRHIPLYSGCTILGDGSVIMIIDLNGIMKSIGEMTLRNSGIAKDENEKINREDKMANLLLFRVSSGAPKVVPLELVSRLEEIDMDKTEVSGGRRVIQYRGGLMRLINPDDSCGMPESGIHDLIVFSDNNKTMGLVVKEIIDIVSHHIDTQLKVTDNGFLGSVIVNGTTCDMIDIGYYFAQTFQDQNDMVAISEHSKKILLIDDSPFFRKFIPPTLEAAGYAVITAAGAEEALHIMESGAHISVIITDMNMPGMSGQEFVMECKKDSRFSSIPIIALSSHTSEEMSKSTSENIMEQLSGYISKTNHSGLIELIAENMHAR